MNFVKESETLNMMTTEARSVNVSYLVMKKDAMNCRDPLAHSCDGASDMMVAKIPDT